MDKIQVVKAMYDQTMALHHEAKKELEDKINEAINDLIVYYSKNTGCVVTGIDFEVMSHHSFRGGLKDADKSFITQIKIKTNID